MGWGRQIRVADFRGQEGVPEGESQQQNEKDFGQPRPGVIGGELESAESQLQADDEIPSDAIGQLEQAQSSCLFGLARLQPFDDQGRLRGG